MAIGSRGVFGSPLKRVYGETASLTTTAYHLAVLPGYHEVMMYCSSAWRMALCPRLVRAYVYLNSAGTYTDYTPHVTDRSSSTHLPLDGFTANDILYLGFSRATRGVKFDLNATNKNAIAATLDVEYASAYDGTTVTWTDVSGDSDGTDTGPGTTLSQDGLYAWTLPTIVQAPVSGTLAYWVRMKPSTTISATIDVEELIPAASDVNYAYMEAGYPYQFSINRAEVGAFEFDHTGTGTLDITWIQH